VKSWLIGLVVASVSFGVFASDDIYLHCAGINDTKFPSANVKISKSLFGFGSREVEVYAEGRWKKVKVLRDEKLEVAFEDGWGNTPKKACKTDPEAPLFCPTYKVIPFTVFQTGNGREAVRLHEYAVRKCCDDGKIRDRGDGIDSSYCILMKTLD
jgi:hypothetical protein